MSKVFSVRLKDLTVEKIRFLSDFYSVPLSDLITQLIDISYNELVASGLDRDEDFKTD